MQRKIVDNWILWHATFASISDLLNASEIDCCIRDVTAKEQSDNGQSKAIQSGSTSPLFT